MRCAKFGVVIFKASMLDWRGVNLPYVYVHCSIYIDLLLDVCQVWCSSIQGIYAQLKGAICHMYKCIVLYMPTYLV